MCWCPKKILHVLYFKTFTLQRSSGSTSATSVGTRTGKSPKVRRPFHVCHDDLVVPDHASVEHRIKLKFKRSKLAEILSNAVMYMSCILDIDAWHILAYFVPRKPPKPFIFSQDIIGLMTLHEALAQLVTSAKRRLHGSKIPVWGGPQG